MIFLADQYNYVQVPSSMSPPNLHIAVCRLGLQELERGSAANESEWYMER